MGYFTCVWAKQGRGGVIRVNNYTNYIVTVIIQSVATSCKFYYPSEP